MDTLFEIRPLNDDEVEKNWWARPGWHGAFRNGKFIYETGASTPEGCINAMHGMINHASPAWKLKDFNVAKEGEYSLTPPLAGLTLMGLIRTFDDVVMALSQDKPIKHSRRECIAAIRQRLGIRLEETEPGKNDIPMTESPLPGLAFIELIEMLDKAEAAQREHKPHKYTLRECVAEIRCRLGIKPEPVAPSPPAELTLFEVLGELRRFGIGPDVIITLRNGNQITVSDRTTEGSDGA